MPEGGKLSPPVREEQSLPLNDDNRNNATNHLENEQPSEAEAANRKETPTDISEEPQLSEEMPLENIMLDPSGNTTYSGRSVKLTPRMAESMVQRDQGIVAC